MSKDEHKKLLREREREWELFFRAVKIDLLNTKECGLPSGKFVRTEEEREQLSTKLKAIHGTPEARAAKSSRFREIQVDPAVVMKKSAALKKAFADPEVKKRKSEAAKAAWKRRRENST